MTGPAPAARSVAWLYAAAFLAALLLYAHPLCLPVLVQDDFQILAQSWTWPRTVAGLWTPNNEHTMPLGRLLTFAVVWLAGRPTALPLAGVLTGIVGILPAMALTYQFVRRELGHPFYGLVALILFGVSSVYQQAVFWFAASFSVYALDVLLLALLAGQRYRETGRLRWLLACTLCCAAAPCWFATGVLAGPLCCLYFLPRDTREEGKRGRGEEGNPNGPSSPLPLFPSSAFLCRLTPLLGTAAFLAVSLPLTAPQILHLEHYHDRPVADVFLPLTGALYTMRSVVDNLALGAFGITGVTVGTVAALPTLALLVAAGGWWAYHSPRRRLALLGAGLIFGSYLLIYTGRATWNYDQVGFYTPSWTRYHLQPQLGLTLLVCGGLPAWECRWFRLDAGGRLTPGQTRALAWLLGLTFLIQAPRGVLCYYEANPRQAEKLRLIERVSDLCREKRISAEAARRALGELPMPESTTKVDGWEFLRGSDDPKEWSPEEVAEMLKGAADSPPR